MVLCAAMQTTHTITSMEPAAESRPGGRDQYRDSVTRLMQISVDLGNKDIVMTIYIDIDANHFHNIQGRCHLSAKIYIDRQF